MRELYFSVKMLGTLGTVKFVYDIGSWTYKSNPRGHYETVSTGTELFITHMRERERERERKRGKVRHDVDNVTRLGVLL